MKRFYLVAMIIGAAAPLWFFINHFNEQGFGLSLFLQLAFANKVSTGAVADLLISSFIFWVILGIDANRLGAGRIAMLIAANCLIGLSLALPWYLYIRESRAEGRHGLALEGGVNSARQAT